MRCLGLVLVTATLALAACAAPDDDPGDWDPKSAAAYLDQRANWWLQWSNAARDHDTICISCHTVVPYLLVRPALHARLGELTPATPERALLEGVVKRVRLWPQTQPFYTDAHDGPNKSAQSRGTEAVLNASVLTARGPEGGPLDADARAALEHMWAQQLTEGAARGAWRWLDFNLAPWESEDAQFYGAALAALAVGRTPPEYQAGPEVREHLAALSQYLKTHYSQQSLHNRLAALWASATLPGFLTPADGEALAAVVLRRQNSDGGWSLYALASASRKGRTLPTAHSDGYATGLVITALRAAGVSPDEDTQLQRGLAWLAHSQEHGQGLWLASSLNETRDASTPTGRFMSDAATAYAVLALVGQPRRSPIGGVSSRR